jgi:hypothetical protein
MVSCLPAQIDRAVLLPADFDEIENDDQDDDRVGSASDVDASTRAMQAGPSAGEPTQA